MIPTRTRIYQLYQIVVITLQFSRRNTATVVNRSLSAGNGQESLSILTAPAHETGYNS